MNFVITRPLLILSSPALEPYAAVAEPFAPRIIVGWNALARAVAGAPPSAVVLVDAYEESGGAEPSPELWELLERFPSATVAVTMELRSERAADVIRMRDAGVSEVVALERDPPAVAGERLAGALARPLKRRVEAALPRPVSGDARTLLRAAAEVAALGGGSPDLGRAMGVLPATANGWCTRAGLPPARSLLAWMRVLLAAGMLDDHGRSVAGVARACGYANDRGLRRVMMRFLAADPRTLRRQGAFATAIRAFNAVLHARRERVLLGRS